MLINLFKLLSMYSIMYTSVLPRLLLLFTVGLEILLPKLFMTMLKACSVLNWQREKAIIKDHISIP